MNRKNWSPADLSKVTTYPLSERTNKVSVQDFAAPVSSSLLIDDLLESLPKILKGSDLTDLIEAMIFASPDPIKEDILISKLPKNIKFEIVINKICKDY